MTKKIDKNGLCEHRHTINTHPNCFVTKPWYQEDGQRVGYLDIEASDLDANSGWMLSWAIKDLNTNGRDGVRYDFVQPGEFFLDYGVVNKNYDSRIVQTLIEAIRDYTCIVTYYGCVTPGHKILTSDLRWIPVEELKVGDELFGFDENPLEGNRTRNFRKSLVLNNIPIVKPVYKIYLSNGKVLEATADHPWLVKRNNLWTWRKTEELIHANGRNTMSPILETWEPNNSYDAGYVAGFFDSEGGIYQAKRNDRDYGHTLSITATQNYKLNGNIVDKVRNSLYNLGFQSEISYYDLSNREQVSIQINGGIPNKLKFLGSIRPEKISNLDINKLGSMKWDDYPDEVEILKIEYSGEKMVMGLETSTKTYIVDGFCSHNTGFDIPFIRSRAMKLGLQFPRFDEIGHVDLYYHVRSKMKLSRNSLSVSTKFLGISGKTHLDYDYWKLAAMGDTEAMEELIEHNVQDVLILQRLHKKLERFSKFTRKSL